MNTTALLARNLSHYRRLHAAVALGVFAGTAVLGGALLVGDSVRGSLRDLTLNRLGDVDHALESPRFLREGFGRCGIGRLAATPLIRLLGSLQRIDKQSGETLARTGRVNVMGIKKAEEADKELAFWQMVATPDPKLGDEECAISAALAEDLKASVGDVLLVQVDEPSDISREALFGKKTGSLPAIRLTIKTILPEEGAGRFSLSASQQFPRNLFMNLRMLQEKLQLAGRANVFLIVDEAVFPYHDRLKNATESAKRLNSGIADRATPADLGLKVRMDAARQYLSIESPAMLVDPVAEAAVLKSAAALGRPAIPMLTHLANSIGAAGKSVPYSTVTALDTSAVGLKLIDGSPAPKLADDEILLSEFAAEAAGLDLLAAPIGTPITITYYREGERGELSTHTQPFKLRGIVKLEGAAADPGFTPEYPGITDKANFRDWNPPFPVDLTKVKRRDDLYWNKHRATPKAFVSLATGRALWAGRFGGSTGIRIPVGADEIKTIQDRFADELRKHLTPEKTGLTFRAVKAEGLEASSGGTDFGGLFIGFSLFLIVSALLLVGLMFRLGVEQRLRELGVLTALGFTAKRVRNLLMAEGAVAAILGGLPGVAGAVGYAWLMMYGLRHWWSEAVGTPFLQLHVTALSLAIAAIAGPVLALLSIAWALRGIRHASPRQLLGGIEAMDTVKLKPGRKARVTAIVAGVLAIGLIAAAFAVTGQARAGMFFGAGAAMLTALLALLSDRLRNSSGGAQGWAARSLGRLAVRNGGRRPTRSVLTAGLMASAAFLIVAVATSKHDASRDVLRKDSGAGGFPLMLETDSPVIYDPGTVSGRKQLGFSKSAQASLEGSTIVGLRLKPGDDASCRNLHRPSEPRILGVADGAFAGRFAFGSTLAPTDAEKSDPWKLLSRTFDDGAVPALGDGNSVQWILHKSLGEDVIVRGDDGSEVKLRIVGTLAGSVFQSELIISDRAFVKHFPTRGGHRVFLVEPGPVNPSAPAPQLALNEALADYGVFVESTAERLTSFAAVENTYLDTFKTLGSLGLLLGTLGLGAVMLRSVLERRGELALMRAMGFRRGRLAALVMIENGLLLLAGLGIGTVSALSAVAPQLFDALAGLVPWGSLALNLGVIAATGMLAGVAAAIAVLRVPVLRALRSE